MNIFAYTATCSLIASYGYWSGDLILVARGFKTLSKPVCHKLSGLQANCFCRFQAKYLATLRQYRSVGSRESCIVYIYMYIEQLDTQSQQKRGLVLQRSRSGSVVQVKLLLSLLPVVHVPKRNLRNVPVLALEHLQYPPQPTLRFDTPRKFTLSFAANDTLAGSLTESFPASSIITTLAVQTTNPGDFRPFSSYKLLLCQPLIPRT